MTEKIMLTYIRDFNVMNFEKLFALKKHKTRCVCKFTCWRIAFNPEIWGKVWCAVYLSKLSPSRGVTSHFQRHGVWRHEQDVVNGEDGRDGWRSSLIDVFSSLFAPRLDTPTWTRPNFPSPSELSSNITDCNLTDYFQQTLLCISVYKILIVCVCVDVKL